MMRELDDLVQAAGQAAEEMGGTVSDALRTGDFSHLSGDLEQSVLKVTSRFDTRVNRAGGNPYSGAGYQNPGMGYQNPGAGYQNPGMGYQNPAAGNNNPDSGYHRPGAAPAGSAWYRYGRLSPQDIRSLTNVHTDFTDRMPGQVPAVLKAAAGTIGAVLFGLASISGLVLMLVGIASAMADLAVYSGMSMAVFLAGAVFSGFMARRGREEKVLVKRFYEYQKAIGKRSYISIAELAQLTGYPEDTVRKDLLRMKQMGMLPQATFDLQKTTIMLTDSAFKQYQEAERARREREAAERAAGRNAASQMFSGAAAGAGTGNFRGAESSRQGTEAAGAQAASGDAAMWAPTGDPQIDTLLSEGKAAVLRIRAYNDRIPESDPMSDKLYQLEDTCRRIFAQVRKDPSSATDCRRLMSYYLPTTEKLLGAYVELNAQPEAGENITGTKTEIVSSMDVINQAFAKLLDRMFQDRAWDIASDINVMKTMMAQDGLTGDASENGGGEDAAGKQKSGGSQTPQDSSVGADSQTK